MCYNLLYHNRLPPYYNCLLIQYITRLFVLLSLFIILIGFPTLSFAQDKNSRSSDGNKYVLILDLVNKSDGYDHYSTEIPDKMMKALNEQRIYHFIPRNEVQKVIKKNNIKKRELRKKETAVDIGKEVGAHVVILGSYEVEGNILTAKYEIASVRQDISSTHQVEGQHNIYLYLFVDESVEALYDDLNRMLGLKIKKYIKREEKPTPEPSKEEDHPVHLNLKIGFPIVFGYQADNAGFNLPYFALSYSHYFSETFFLETEVGYFSNEMTGFTTKTVTEHVLPITASVGWRIKLSDAFFLSPTIGAGYGLVFTETSLDESTTSSSILLRASVGFDYKISESFYIGVEVPFYVRQSLTGADIGENLNYYLIPLLKGGYQF